MYIHIFVDTYIHIGADVCQTRPMRGHEKFIENGMAAECPCCATCATWARPHLHGPVRCPSWGICVNGRTRRSRQSHRHGHRGPAHYHHCVNVSVSGNC